MDGISRIITVARAYAEATGLDLVTVSWRVFADSKKLDALIGGADIQVRRAEKALTWFGDNWPVDAAWPEGVERPVRRDPGGVGPSGHDDTLPGAAVAGAGKNGEVFP